MSVASPCSGGGSSGNGVKLYIASVDRTNWKNAVVSLPDYVHLIEKMWAFGMYGREYAA
jgi:hypothetical protein